MSEEEENHEKNKSNKDGEKDDGNKIKSFFMDPNNNPKNEALMLLAAMLGAGYYIYSYK